MRSRSIWTAALTSALTATLIGAATNKPEPLLGLIRQAMARAGTHTVDSRLQQFGEAARARLAPRFSNAGLGLPPAEIALLGFKDTAQLELYARDAGGIWRFVHRYPILAASGAAGPKLRQGDHQVPEGEYAVSFLNANSAYHVSLRLDYPNAFDRRMAQRDGRGDLGGDIMIHGRAVSIGCLAMGDTAAEELFALAAWTGMQRVRVLIAPTDFRRAPDSGSPPATQPPWVAALYAQLRMVLAAFPPA